MLDIIRRLVVCKTKDVSDQNIFFNEVKRNCLCDVSKVAVMAVFKRCLPLAQVAVLLLLLTGSTNAGPEMDPYKILGLTRSASQAEIKKVYKRLAKEWQVPSFLQC